VSSDMHWLPRHLVNLLQVKGVCCGSCQVVLGMPPLPDAHCPPVNTYPGAATDSDAVPPNRIIPQFHRGQP
jgi:hypothetical protein